jgi:hypothetical protein
MVMQRGVSLNDLVEKGNKSGGFDTTSGFSKKTNKGNRIFWIAAGLVGAALIGGIIFLIVQNH